MEESPREAWGQSPAWSSSRKARTGRKESWKVRSIHKGKEAEFLNQRLEAEFHFLGFLSGKLRSREGKQYKDLVTVLEERVRDWVPNIRHVRGWGSKLISKGTGSC